MGSPTTMRIKVQYENVTSVPLRQRMRCDGQAIEYAKALTSIPLRMMKATRQATSHAISQRSFTRREHSTTRVQGHSQHLGIPLP